MPIELDDEMVIARAFAQAAQEKKSLRRSRRATPARRSTRAWWTAGGAVAATHAAAAPEPMPDDGVKEAPEMTLAEFLDGM